MKGLLKYKPIHEGIICHATLDDFGQFLLTSRIKNFQIVINQLQFNLKFIIFGYSLNSIRYRTHKICLEAVKKCGHELRYVKNQTEDIIQAAVNQNPYSKRFINNKKHPLYLSAVIE